MISMIGRQRFFRQFLMQQNAKSKNICSWYLGEGHVQNPTAPNKKDLESHVPVEKLWELTFVEVMKFDARKVDTNSDFSTMRKERSFSYEDEVDLAKGSSEENDKILAQIFGEHLHAHDEVRMVLKGSGYFDVRDKNDNWIRIATERDDMIIVPAGCYHRFTLDQKNYFKCKRLFVGSPIWTAYYRPDADSHSARRTYLARRQAE